MRVLLADDLKKVLGSFPELLNMYNQVETNHGINTMGSMRMLKTDLTIVDIRPGLFNINVLNDNAFPMFIKNASKYFLYLSLNLFNNLNNVSFWHTKN